MIYGQLLLKGVGVEHFYTLKSDWRGGSRCWEQIIWSRIDTVVNSRFFKEMECLALEDSQLPYKATGETVQASRF